MIIQVNNLLHKDEKTKAEVVYTNSNSEPCNLIAVDWSNLEFTNQNIRKDCQSVNQFQMFTNALLGIFDEHPVAKKYPAGFANCSGEYLMVRITSIKGFGENTSSKYCPRNARRAGGSVT